MSRYPSPRSALTVVVVAGALLGAGGSADVAAHGPTRPAAVDPFLPDPDEVVPTDDLTWIIDGFQLELGYLELDLESEVFGEPLASDFDRVDELLARTDQLLARAGTTTFGDLDRLVLDIDALWSEVLARGGASAGTPPFAAAPGSDDGTAPTSSAAPPSGPSATVESPAGDAATTTANDAATTASDPGFATAQAAAIAVYREAALLLALDAFGDDTSILAALVERVGRIELTGGETRPELMALLEAADAHTAESLGALAALEPPIGPGPRETVASLDAVDLEAIANGAIGPTDATTYLRSIDSLLNSAGRPLPIDEQTTEVSVLAHQLRSAMAFAAADATAGTAGTAGDAADVDDVDGNGATSGPVATIDPGAEPVGGTGDAPATGPGTATAPSTGWTLQTWLLLAIGGAGLLAIAGWYWERHRRARLPRPAGGPGFHDLLDVSRRLAEVGSTSEAEEVAVRQAVRLTGASAGAYLRHTDRRLSEGFATEDGMLVDDRLADGVLDRVVGAGQELMLVSRTEPAIRNLPVSLLAAPVFSRGAVVGAILLLRDAADPFTDRELAMLSDLKPIVGAAMETVSNAQRAESAALTDALTGVANRRALDRAVAEHAAIAGTPAAWAAIMVDLDHFKSVNDSFGHQAGDDLIRAAAGRIVANVRPGDRVYRYGGEEFAIVLPDTGEGAAAHVAERVRTAIADHPFVIGPARIEHRATASLGVAAGDAGDTVIGRADAALYAAKQRGRDRVERATPADDPGVGHHWPAPDQHPTGV